MEREEFLRLPHRAQQKIAEFLPHRVVASPQLLLDYLRVLPINYARVELDHHPVFQVSFENCVELYMGILEDYRVRVKEVKITGDYTRWQKLIRFVMERESFVCLTLKIRISSDEAFGAFVHHCAKSKNPMHKFILSFGNMTDEAITRNMRELVSQDRNLVSLTADRGVVPFQYLYAMAYYAPFLTCLQLHGVAGVTPRDIETLLRNQSGLQRLELCATNGGDAMAQIIASALLLGHGLKHLSLVDQGMSDIGAISLATALCENTSLLTLHLGDQLGDPSAYAFAEVLLLNRTILGLKFDRCWFSVQGASSIVDVLQTSNMTLETLMFRGCGQKEKENSRSYTWMSELRCTRRTEDGNNTSCEACRWPYNDRCLNTSWMSSSSTRLHLRCQYANHRMWQRTARA